MTLIRPVASRLNAIVIGTSTGGPAALERLLSHLRAPPLVPILVVHHMPASFTTMLAERLNRTSSATVVEAETGMVPQAGVVYIAPGGRHMTVFRDEDSVRIKLNTRAPVNSCRPSVDVLFNSTALVWGANQLGVIMTGMGSDGLAGSGALARVGAEIYIQDRATSVVWGMPGSVADAGLAAKVLPIDDLGPAIESRLDAWPASAAAAIAGPHQRDSQRLQRRDDLRRRDDRGKAGASTSESKQPLEPGSPVSQAIATAKASADAARLARVAVESARSSRLETS